MMMMVMMMMMMMMENAAAEYDLALRDQQRKRRKDLHKCLIDPSGYLRPLVLRCRQPSSELSLLSNPISESETSWPSEDPPIM